MNERSGPIPPDQDTPPTADLRRLLELCHLAPLGIWCGMLLLAGFTAATTFPTVKALNPALPGLEGYSGEQWKLVAGRVMDPVFGAVTWAGAVIALWLALSLFVMLGLCGLSLARRVNAVRGIVVGLLLGLAGYDALVLRPQMTSELRAHWEAVDAGDYELSAQHQAAFEELHPRASFVLQAEAVIGVLALGLGIWSATGFVSRGRRDG